MDCIAIVMLVWKYKPHLRHYIKKLQSYDTRLLEAAITLSYWYKIVLITLEYLLMAAKQRING
jgi:hypothetical protein